MNAEDAETATAAATALSRMPRISNGETARINGNREMLWENLSGEDRAAVAVPKASAVACQCRFAAQNS